MISQIAEAIEGMGAQEVVEYLATLRFDADPGLALRSVGASPATSPAYLLDPGAGFQPGTWSEVEYLWFNDVIDVATYLEAKQNYLAEAARAAANPTLRQRRITYRRDAHRERHLETGSLPVMVCKGLLTGLPQMMSTRLA